MAVRAATAALACALAALVLLPGSASAAGLKAIWGPGKLPDQSSAFNAYEELGVDVFQLQVDWAHVAKQRPANPTDPADPAYDWSSATGATIADAAAHGIDVALLVKGTPAWAVASPSPTHKVATRRPDDVGDYADFLTAVSAKHPSVRRWMIWGETNRNAVWSSGPIAYADLLDAAYGALKAASASNVVIGGMTFTYGETSPAAWLAAMRRSGAGGTRPRLDEYGHNPFTRRCPDLSQGPDYLATGARDISDVDTLVGEVRTAFGAETDLWLSEFTISSDRANRALDFFVNRAQQADWLRKAYALAGSVDYVSGLGWFNLHDEPLSVFNGLTTGLMTYLGEHKPAWDAYAAAELDGSQPTVACPLPPPTLPEPGPSPVPAGLPHVPAGRPHVPIPRPIVSAPPLPFELVAPLTGSLRKTLRSGYRIEVRCRARCTLAASLLLGRGDARKLGLGRKTTRIGATRVEAAAGKAVSLRLKPTRKAARRLKRLRSVELTVALVATDASGPTRMRRTVRLRR
jgi:hypothetical protein